MKRTPRIDYGSKGCILDLVLTPSQEQVHIYKVAKLAPRSQVAANKRGFSTFNSFIFIFKMAKPSYFSLPPPFLNKIFCREFSAAVRMFSAPVKTGQINPQKK